MASILMVRAVTLGKGFPPHFCGRNGKFWQNARALFQLFPYLPYFRGEKFLEKHLTTAYKYVIIET